MSSRIVLRDEIQNQINMIGALSGDVPAGNVRSYKELHDSINTTLSSAQEAVGRRLGKNYTEQIKQLNRRTTTLYQTSMVAFDVLVKCRDTYQGMDQYLRTQADGLGDYSACENPAYQTVYHVPDWAKGHERKERTYGYTAENGGRGWVYIYNYYNEPGKGTQVSCTYYTLRKLDERGLGYPFKYAGGANGKEWYGNCSDAAIKEPGKGSIEALYNGYANNKELHNVVVSIDTGTKWGHVLLLDKVFRGEDGQLKVSYTDMSYYDGKKTQYLSDPDGDTPLFVYSVEEFTKKNPGIVGSVLIGE